MVARSFSDELRGRGDTITLFAQPRTIRAASLRVWLARVPFDPAPATVSDFCALATERSRLLDPTFPAFAEPTRGGSLFIRDRGPAEVIHEDEWVATYWGPGCPPRLSCLRSGTLPVTCWEEPFERP